jgi:hypothetical protein
LSGGKVLEIVLIILLAAPIAWIVWKVRAHDRALENASLHEAWRMVLDDPHYEHRRQYEERKRQVEAQLQKEAARL